MTNIFSVGFEECPFRLQEIDDKKPSNWYCINYGSTFFKDLIKDLQAQINYIVQSDAEDRVEEKIAEKYSSFSSPMNFVLCLSSTNIRDNSALNLKEVDIIKSIFHLARFLQKTYGFGENAPGKFYIIGENLTPILMGLAGLVKILNREWSQAECRFIAVEQANCVQILQELSYKNSPADVYYKNHNAYTRSIKIIEKINENPNITRKDVFLVTAGARGITAQCCLKLAKETQCSFILIGRTSLHLGKFESIRLLKNTHEMMLSIRNILLQHQTKVTPKEVLSIFKNVQSVFDIENTLKRLEVLGSRVKYYVCDITQESELSSIIVDYAEAWGPITGAIHGAGNLNDKLIVEETENDIDDVIQPKIKGLYNIINLESFKNFKWCIIFSSISSLFGNKGQSAYAVANEILNQTAIKMNALYSHCKTIALCWGAWELGMVTESLKSVFAKRGISLLSAEEGSELFWRSFSVNHPYIILDKYKNMHQRLQEHKQQNYLLNREALEDISLNADIAKYFGSAYLSMLNFNPRLRMPAPPFLFVSRIIKISTEKRPGCVGEMWFEYEIPNNTLFQKNGTVHEVLLAESCHAITILAYILLRKELLLSPSALRGSNGSIVFYDANPLVGTTIQIHVCVEAVLNIPAGKLLKQVFIGSYNSLPVFKIESYAAIIDPNKVQLAIFPTPYQQLVQKSYNFFSNLAIQEFYQDWNICHLSNILLHRVKIYSLNNENNTNIVVGEYDLSPDHWIFKSHFVDDPLFPASMMHFSLFQLLCFYVYNKKQCFSPQTLQYARDLKTQRKLIHSLYPCHETVYFHLEINTGNEKNAKQITAKAFVYLEKIMLAEYENIGIEWET